MALLIVDDSPQHGMLLQHFLTKGGFQDVRIVESAKQAFEMLALHDPLETPEIELVLMDLLMPDMDGIEACRIINGTEHLCHIPVIMVTGVTDLDSLQAAFDSGAVDYIMKPVKKVELLARVRSVLKLRQQEEILQRLNEELRGMNEGLERRVEERTSELQEKTRHLQEVNTALKILLRQREEDRNELEEAVLSNVKNLILPYVVKLRGTHLTKEQSTYVDILEGHMGEITSPFIKRLSQEFLGLTPVEIRVTDLIREGRTTKEIAEVLHRSESTILFHRDNIRRKLCIKEKKVNLRSYLRSFY